MDVRGALILNIEIGGIMTEIIIFTDEELDCMLNHNGVVTMELTNRDCDMQFMSEKQYEKMYPKDRNCPFSNVLKKNSDDCGVLGFCEDCEWWKSFLNR